MGQRGFLFKPCLVFLLVVGGQCLNAKSEECTEPPEQICPVCDCDGARDPHPIECDWYYECKDGAPVLTKCKEGLHFNPTHGICDYPCYAGCGEVSPPVTTPKPTNPPTQPPTEPPTEPPTKAPTEPPTEPPTEAPTEPPTKAPTEPPTEAPTEPPTEAPTEPPTKTPTEPPTKAPTEPPTEAPTEPPTEAPTKPTTNAPTEPPTEAPTEPPTKAPTQPPTEAPTEPSPELSTEAPSSCPPPNVEPQCPEIDPVPPEYIPHDTDCNYFFQCGHGVAYCQQCPPGLDFNPTTKNCDTPEAAGCQASKSSLVSR